MGGAKEDGRSSVDSSDTPASRLPRLFEDDADLTVQTGIATRAARPRKKSALMVLSGSAVGRIFPIRRAKITIGRSKEAAFTLEDHGISRMHCGISQSGGTYFLSDLGSTNGTLVNGERVERVALRAGDRIQVGPNTVIRFELYEEADGGFAKKQYEAATRDLLTGALNRRALDERLASEVPYAVRHHAKLVAIALEVEGLSAFAAAFGQAVGDALLSEVATAITATLRAEDLLGRDGAGFVVLCRGLSSAKATRLVERFRKVVLERVVDGIGEHRIRLGVGIAELSELPDANGKPHGDALLELARSRLVAAAPRESLSLAAPALPG